MLLSLSSGREMNVTLIRGPLWPSDDVPPSAAVERANGIIETVHGNFGSMTELAVFYGCIIDHGQTGYVESN